MSPRTRITTTVDVDIPSPDPARGKTKYWVNLRDTDIREWLESQAQPNLAVRKLIYQFIKTHGTGDLFEVLPEERFDSGEREMSGVRLFGVGLEWLENQSNRSASIRYVIRRHVDSQKALHTAPSRVGRSRDKTLANISVRISWDDTDLLAWLGADGNASRAMRQAVVTFVENNGCDKLDIVSPPSQYNAEGCARSIGTDINDERVTEWLEAQSDKSAALRHAFRWYIENYTRIPVRETVRRHIATTTASLSSAPEPKFVTPIPAPATPAASQSTSSLRIAEAIELMVSSGREDPRVSELQEQVGTLTTAFYTLSGQIQQLIPGAHRAQI